MYRPQIKVCDCTIRDGGLMNNSHFSLKDVQSIYRALTEAGVDIIELGYRNSKTFFSPDKYGGLAFLRRENAETGRRRCPKNRKNSHHAGRA